VNSKQIIILVVVIVVLAVAGVFGYKAMTGSSSTETATAVPKSLILPNGSKLDFEKVQEFNKKQKLFPYPEVNTAEIGKQLNQIVTPKIEE
jgi:flagellar basal body-associated protein FliL